MEKTLHAPSRRILLSDPVTVTDTQTGTMQQQLTYTGTWQAGEEALAYGGTWHTASAAGSSATLRFYGVQFTLSCPKTAGAGIAAVSVDGGQAAPLDLYSAAPQASAVVYTSPLLPKGVHTVQITCTGEKNPASQGAVIFVDRLDLFDDVGAPNLNPDAPLIIDDKEIGDGLYQFTYSDNWTYSGSYPAFSNSNHYTSTPGAVATFRFIGTQVKVYSPKGASNGFAGYSIDGGEETLGDLYAPSDESYSLIYESPELEAGEHVLRIRCTGEGPGPHINVDRVDVYGASLPEDDWQLVFHDEFNAPNLDRSKWDPWWCDFDGHFQFPDGGSIDQNMVSADFIKLENGAVQVGNGLYDQPKMIGNRIARGANTSLITKYTHLQTYGFLECRFRRHTESTPNGFAFWTMPGDGFLELGGGSGAELDMIENSNEWGGQSSKSNTIWGGYGGGFRITNTDWNAEGIRDGEYHTIAVDWTPAYLRYYYDGNLIATHTTASGDGVPQGPEYLILTGGNSMEDAYAYVDVDYVRAYQRSGQGSLGRQEDSENKVVNGDFEAGTLAPWQETCGVTLDTTNQHSGNACLRATGDENPVQRLTGLLPWAKYRLTAWVKLENPAETASVEVKEYAIDNRNAFFIPKRATATGEGYQQLTIDFVMGSYLKSPTVQLVYQGGSSAYFDDITVVQLPDIALHKPATASGIYEGNLFYEPQKAVDGFENTNADPGDIDEPWRASSTKWMAEGEGPHWLMVDLKETYPITRYTVRHAGPYEGVGYNTRDFVFQASTDGQSWADLDTVTGNTADVTESTVPPTPARYVRLYITNPQTASGDPAARIYELAVYGG